MIVLDTNLVSALMRTPIDAPVAGWMSARAVDELAVTTISIFEIAYGIERLPRGKRRTALEGQFAAVMSAQAFVLHVLSDAAAPRGGALLARRRAMGRPGTNADMMIAGIAAELGASIATRNVRDFDGLGLTVIDPWTA